VISSIRTYMPQVTFVLLGMARHQIIFLAIARKITSLWPRLGGKDSAPAREFVSGGNWVSSWEKQQKNLYEQHKYDTDGRGNPRP